MNQEIIESLLENRVQIVMQPERCYVLEHLDRYLPGNEEKGFILRGLTGLPCYPNCSGYSLTCNEHPWNKHIISVDAIQDDMRELSGIEIAIANPILPVGRVSPVAIEKLDMNTCTWLTGIIHRSIMDKDYSPNGDVKTQYCSKCDGHGKTSGKSCSLYMKRTSGVEQLTTCIAVFNNRS